MISLINRSKTISFPTVDTTGVVTTDSMVVVVVAVVAVAVAVVPLPIVIGNPCTDVNDSFHKNDWGRG